VGVIIIAKGLHDLLPCKVLPLALKLCLGGLEVHLLSLQVFCLLVKVVRAAVGTQVRWCELSFHLREMRCEGQPSMLLESYSSPPPERISRKVHSKGTSVRAMSERMALWGASQLMRCSSSSWKDASAF
jgi:hypothetical protein